MTVSVKPFNYKTNTPVCMYTSQTRTSIYGKIEDLSTAQGITSEELKLLLCHYLTKLQGKSKRAFLKDSNDNLTDNSSGRTT